MAPTKKNGEKETKLTPNESSKMILDYLRRTNRPYSATDISSNLNNRVTKASAQKLLKDMHERKEIEGRAAGKQVVYHALQDEPDTDLVEKLQGMDAEIARLRDSTAALKSEEKDLRASLRGSTSLVPLPQLKASNAELEQQRADVEARLAQLKSGDLKPVSKAARDQVTKRWRTMKRAAEARKKIRKEVYKTLEDFVGKEKAAEFAEQADITLS